MCVFVAVQLLIRMAKQKVTKNIAFTKKYLSTSIQGSEQKPETLAIRTKSSLHYANVMDKLASLISVK